MNGAEIRRRREARNWTQQRLAAELQVGARTVGNWERGETVPKNRMGRLEEVLSDGSASRDPLADLSDAALLHELLRRAIARE